MVKSVVESSIETVLDVAETITIKVLHVDDDPVFLEVAKQCLESQGKIEVETAHSVDEALEKLKKTDYDAIVCDYQMPDKDGLEFLKELRNKGNPIPFVIFTGKGREEVAVNALNLGADQYVDKHGNPETVYFELAHGIGVAVEQKKVEKALFTERERLETVTRNIGAGLALISKDYRTLWANDTLKQIFGDVEGKLCYSTYNQRNDICPKCGVQEIFETGKVKVVHEQVGTDVDGKTIWSEITATPVKDRDGHITAALELVVPITQRKKAERELHASEEKYRSLFANMLNGFAYCKMIFDGKGKPVDFVYLDVNDAFERITGLKKEDVIGKRVTEAIPGTEITHPEMLDIYGRVASTGKEEKFELFFKPLSIWLSVLVHSPRKGYFAAVIENTTERRKAEEALRKSEEKFKNLFDCANDAVMYLDRNGRILEVNGRTVEMFGGTREELTGKQFTKIGIFSIKETPMLMRNFADVLAGKKANLNVSIKNKKGQEIALECSVSLVETDESAGIVVVARDVSESKKAEEEKGKLLHELGERAKELSAREERYRSYIEVTGQLGWTTNANGEVEEDIPAWMKFTGQNFEEVKGWGWMKAIHPDDLKHTTQVWEEAVATKANYEVEYRVRRYDGVYRYFMARGVPVFREDGSIREWVGTCVDITEHKNSEEDLRSSEERLNIMFQYAPDAYYLSDLKGNFVDGNEAAEEVTGYTKNELIGKSFLKLKLLPRSQALKAAKLLAMNALGKPTGLDEFVLNRKDGTQVPVEIRTYPVRIKDKTVVLGIARDISIRKKDEQTVKESQQKFEGLFSHNPEATVYLDSGFRILDANPRFCQLFGYSAKEVKGKGINEVVTPEDMIEEAERLDKDARNGYAGHDTVRKRKDGSLVHVSISAAPVTIEDKPLGYVGVYKDITNLKNAEEHLKEMNKKLEITNEKLRVVGGLTRHDVRNKLSTVTGYAYLLRRKLAEDPEALEQLANMEAAVRLVERIFEFARAYEKLGVEQLARMDVGKVVDEAVSLFSDLKGIKIVNECHGLTILADSLLTQLVYNLVDNSLKHGERTRQIKTYYRTPSADQLELVYEDDGVGIPDNMRSYLFTEGFTLGKGTGYGLFMIKRMCEVYGWTIQETGKQGKGVQFTMSMPRIGNTEKANYQIQNQRQH